jgi:hypothetical protein
MFTALDSYETEQMGTSMFGKLNSHKYSTLSAVATYEIVQLCKELKGFVPFKIRMRGNSKNSINVFKNENTYISLYIPRHILNPQKCLPICYPEVD